MKANIEVEATDISITPSSGKAVNLSFTVDQIDADKIVQDFEPDNILDALDEEYIVDFLERRGYNVTEE